MDRGLVLALLHLEAPDNSQPGILPQAPGQRLGVSQQPVWGSSATNLNPDTLQINPDGYALPRGSGVFTIPRCLCNLPFFAERLNIIAAKARLVNPAAECTRSAQASLAKRQSAPPKALISLYKHPETLVCPLSPREERGWGGGKPEINTQR